MKNSKLLITLSSVLVIYAIIGFIAIPKISKPQVEKIINENINQTASIGKIEFNPFLLKFAAFDIKVQDNNTTTFSLDKIALDFSLLTSLDERHIDFKNLELLNPYINIIEYKDGTFNLQKILKETKEEEKKQEEEKSSDSSIKFQILKTMIKDAKIDFTKYDGSKEPYKVSIHDFNYTFYDMGTFRNVLASHSLELAINQYSKILINGGLRLLPFEMYGNVKIKDLRPTEFTSYEKNLLNFNIDKKASLDLAFGYKVDTKKDLKIEIDNANLNLKNIELTKEKEKFVSLKAFNINDLNLDFPQNIITIDSIGLDGIDSNIVSNKQGLLNIANLVKETPKKEQEQVKESEEKAVAWNIDLKEFNINNSKVNFTDLKNSLKVSTSDINVKLNNFKFKNDKISFENADIIKSKLNFKEGKYNNIDINNITLATKNFEFENNNIKLLSLKLLLENLAIKDTKNSLGINAKKTNLLVSNSSFVNNQIDIQKVKLTEPLVSLIDKKNNQVIKARNIDVNIEKIFQKDNALKILKSVIDKPDISITLGKNTNTKKEQTEKQKAKTVSSSKKSDFIFDIGPVKINNMKMAFEDKNLPIPFKTNVTELNGQFSRLNSSSSKPTNLKLEGKVDKYGYTKITGTVDINDIKLLTNTNILFKNIAIKNFTPYSGKFVGREIDEGKLNLDLKYNIKKSNLDATNSVIISDIKLGKNVESPDAVSLPLELAIALLEDSDGVIDIDLPIKGNVDDPQFSVAPIIWKAFTNLIVKAVTAPFSLLGALFNIDEEKLKTAQFEVGKSDIIASERESLDAIAKILKEKSRLAINVEPSYDSIADKKAIQEQKINVVIKKEMEKINKGDKYLIALEKLYADKKIEIPLDELKESFLQKDKDGKETFNKEDYLSNIKDTLASKEEVSKQELENLVNKRVTSIKEYLFKTKKVDTDALKILEIKESKSSKGKWVNFKLTVTTR